MGTLFLRRKAAQFISDEFGIPTAPATLAKLASVGGGPVFRHFGRRVVYERQALVDWANAKLSSPRRSTSDRGDE